MADKVLCLDIRLSSTKSMNSDEIREELVKLNLPEHWDKNSKKKPNTVQFALRTANNEKLKKEEIIEGIEKIRSFMILNVNQTIQNYINEFLQEDENGNIISNETPTLIIRYYKDYK